MFSCPLGLNAFGPTGEVVYVSEAMASGFGNEIMRVVPDTLHPVPWAASSDNRVGQVLLEWAWISGDTHEVCTRSMARRLMDQLEAEFGYTVMSAFEFEFTLLKKDTEQPVYQPVDLISTLVLSDFEDFLFGMDKQLRQAGIDIESYQTEYGEGQFELATVPKFGIDALDQAFKFKESVKEISRKSDYAATFMTKPFFSGLANGNHYNMSLWNKAQENVFFDPDAKDQMSPTFKHWIAGLIKHTPALSALCNPTVNCYRRLRQAFVHKKIDWGLDNRTATYRAKAYDSKMNYLESRMPTSAANPYVVGAATLAAGMDGLRLEMELPPPVSPDAPKLPQTLGEALEALEQDEVIKEALGNMFVEWFLMAKKTAEIETFKGHDMDNTSEEELAAERKMYLVKI